MGGVIPRVLLACAHHPKPDDLNSISCLLSMRLYRHANNRKFALKGTDQQPLTLSHDSEVSHDSGALERTKKASFCLFCFFFLPPGKLSYHWDCPVSHNLTGGGNLTEEFTSAEPQNGLSLQNTHLKQFPLSVSPLTRLQKHSPP